MNLEPRELAACVGAGICSLFAYLLHHQADRLLDFCSALKVAGKDCTLCFDVSRPFPERQPREASPRLSSQAKSVRFFDFCSLITLMLALGFVAVRGRVECSNPLKTKNGTQAVV